MTPTDEAIDLPADRDPTARGRIVVDVSPSLDGFVAGAGVSVERPFGDAGMALYGWLGLQGDQPSDPDREAADWQLRNTGAIVLGRTMFDVGIGPWGEDGAFHRPCFVVTSRAHPPVVKGPTTFTFVTDGVVTAVREAVAAAGDRDVMIVGGAAVIDQCLAADLVDEVRLHIAPVLLTSGTRLFDGSRDRRALSQVDLELLEAVATPAAVHLKYRVLRSATGRS